jgi:uncharacterized damage-inducible protein DinB
LPTESTESTVPLLSVEPLPGYEPTIGRWLWLLEDTRRETKEVSAGIAPAALDWIPPQGENSIGTLLYHIGLIELDWLYVEALENQPWPEELKPLFTLSARDPQEHLSALRGETLKEHLHRLDLLRGHLLAAFWGMTLEEFRRPRAFPRYRVTAEWVLQHLVQHEGEHRGQIQLLRSLAEGALGAG